MTVLVTGASGFIGKACLQALSRAGHDSLAPASADLNLLDRDAVRHYIVQHKPAHLVHAAWRPVRGDAMTSADNTLWLEASLALARSFYDHGGEHGVFLGSCAEYDWTHGVLKTGATPLAPATPYGAAKHALHLGLQSHATSAGASFSWPRIFFVYGPGEHASRLAMAVTSALLRGEPVELTHGRQVRDYVYVDDVAEGVRAALEKAHAGETDLASGRPRPVRDIAIEIARQLGREDLLRLGARPSPAHDAPVVLGDPSHAFQSLGWSADTTLEDGVAHLIAWARRTPNA